MIFNFAVLIIMVCALLKYSSTVWNHEIKYFFLLVSELKLKYFFLLVTEIRQTLAISADVSTDPPSEISYFQDFTYFSHQHIGCFFLLLFSYVFVFQKCLIRIFIIIKMRIILYIKKEK